MDARLFVLNEEFKHLALDKDTLSEYLSFMPQQKSYIFHTIPYDEVYHRIKNFYTSVKEDGEAIVLSHDLSDKKSIIKIRESEIYIKDAEMNMLLPLLKRLYRNSVLIEI